MMTMTTLLNRKPFSSGHSSSPAILGRLLLGVFVMIAGILAFAPLHPRMPEADLDPSWMLGMNQALAQGLVIGRDIIFTFGPYSAVYTHAYHPATYAWTLVLGLILGYCYAAMLLMAAHERQQRWLWACGLFLLLIDSRDALFFSYPLLVMLVAYRATLPDASAQLVTKATRTRIDYAAAIALLGVLPIIKASFLPLAIAAAIAGFLLYWRARDRAYALLFITLPPIAMTVFWHIAGQPVSAMPDFFRAVAPIISGYTEAMSSFPGKPSGLSSATGAVAMIVCYLMIAMAILASIIRNRCNSLAHNSTALLFLSLFFYLAFKAGFVRHDLHALAASSALAISIILLNITGIARIAWYFVAPALLIWVVIHGHYVGASLRESPISSLIGLASGERLGWRAQAGFTKRIDLIHVESKIPALKGSVDIYPYDQAALIASGNIWRPRPILQSYSAYTSELANINASHLRGSNAPDNIIFRVGTIDNRYPSLDDGPSWMALLSHYAISSSDARYAYFTKRPSPLGEKRTVVIQGNYKLGKTVNLPRSERMLAAQFNITPTLSGRAANLFFKTSPLYITVDLEDGRKKSYRFIPSMARGEFVLSPLIDSTSSFVFLAEGNMAALQNNRVTSIRIAPAGNETPLWNREYSLIISAVDP